MRKADALVCVFSFSPHPPAGWCVSLTCRMLQTEFVAALAKDAVLFEAFASSMVKSVDAVRPGWEDFGKKHPDHFNLNALKGLWAKCQESTAGEGDFQLTQAKFRQWMMQEFQVCWHAGR